MSPGVLLLCKFVRPESKKFNSYIEYIDRDKAVRNANFKKFSAYNDYMDNPAKQQEFNAESDKTSALFTEKADRLTKEQKAVLKKQFATAQENGSPLWQDVISFRNDWLEQNGLYNSKTHWLNEEQIRMVTRQAMRTRLNNEKMYDSAVWAASIHYNTDNIHIHIAVVEPNPTRQLIENEDGSVERRGKLKQSTLDKMKSTVANRIVDRSETLNRINQMIRENIIAARPDDAFMNDRELQQAFMDIYKKLPTDKRQWKYNMNGMKKLRPEIDRLSRMYIDHYHAKDFHNLQLELDKEQAYLKSVYGSGKKEKYMDYRKNKMQDLYTRLGNSILTEMRNFDRRSNLEPQSLPKTQRSQRQKSQSQKSESTTNKEVRPMHFKQSNRHRGGSRLQQNYELDKSLQNLKRSINADCKSEFQNERDYSEMLYRTEVAERNLENDIPM